MTARLRLRRADGRVYLDRRGIEHDRIGGVFLHKMEAPDPGRDLHDHRWWFGSLILWGGYTEERAHCRDAPMFARIAGLSNLAVGGIPISDGDTTKGYVERRRWLSWRTMRLDECHRITELHRPTVWTLVVHGPPRRGWGFYLADGFMPWRVYDSTMRRDLFAEIGDDRVAGR